MHITSFFLILSRSPFPFLRGVSVDRLFIVSFVHVCDMKKYSKLALMIALFSS